MAPRRGRRSLLASKRGDRVDTRGTARREATGERRDEKETAGGRRGNGPKNKAATKHTKNTKNTKEESSVLRSFVTFVAIVSKMPTMRRSSFRKTGGERAGRGRVVMTKPNERQAGVEGGRETGPQL